MIIEYLENIILIFEVIVLPAFLIPTLFLIPAKYTPVNQLEATQLRNWLFSSILLMLFVGLLLLLFDIQLISLRLIGHFTFLTFFLKLSLDFGLDNYTEV